MITLNKQRVELNFSNSKTLLPTFLFTSTFQYSNKIYANHTAYFPFIIFRTETSKDNLFYTYRLPTIYNSYTYNSLKHNSYEVIDMVSRYTALAIKIDNFIGNMPSLSLNISKTRSQPHWFLFTNLKGIPWCIPTLSLKKSTVIYFSVCDKLNISAVSKLGKFAFVHWKIVNINKIVEANSKVCL